jgi:quercetin dioxygenase-like cupin family protein
MRRVVTGLDANGRSTVVEDGPPPVAFEAASSTEIVRRPDVRLPLPEGYSVIHQLWCASTTVRRNEVDPTTTLQVPNFDTPSGATSWILTELAPGASAPMHDTQTIDYGLIVRGEVQLGLETGSVTLRAGDAVFVDGVLHSWAAGPDGCTIATVQVGLSERAS